MKKIFLFLFVISTGCISVFAQESTYTIKGDLEKIKSGVIYLNIYTPGEQSTDSTTIVNGKFQFKGDIKSPAFASLLMKNKPADFFTFYLEPGNLDIRGRADSLGMLSIKGSHINDDDRILKERLKDVTLWENNNSKIYEKAYQENNKKILDSLDEVDNDILMAKRKVIASFVKEHPNSMRAAMAITENYGYYAEATDVKPLYDLLSQRIKDTEKGKEIKKMVEVYSAVAIGQLIPEINQYDTDSNLVSLHSLKGKYVLVDFWASWCGPCRRENPNIVAAYQQFKDKGFTVFGVSYDTRKDNWIQAIANDHLDWYQVSQLNGWDNSTSSQFGIKAIPSNMLIDKNGKIIAKNLFGRKLVETLESLLK